MYEMCRSQGYGMDLYQEANYLEFLFAFIYTCLLHQCSKLKSMF